MDARQSDVFVFFGATGDLAFKKIFPSLQAMVKRGHLDIPVIGVARFAKNVEDHRTRARDSLAKHGGRACDSIRLSAFSSPEVPSPYR
jgi:glucose-6-phosphate 1-dehydrogenase